MFQAPQLGPPAGSLLREGRAMIGALAEDFRQLPGVRVVAMQDVRVPDGFLPGCEVVLVESAGQEAELLAQRAVTSDWTVVIAPELDGWLLRRCRLVHQAGGRLLGPGLDVVELASDKQQTCEHLLRHGVRVPEGRVLEPAAPLPTGVPYPAVLKPCWGAGSVGLQRIDSPRGRLAPGAEDGPWRLERFCPGTPASVSFLCGPEGAVPLPACSQRLSQDGRFRYVGGQLLSDPELRRRATTAAAAALRALPALLGYVGVDLVLGAARDGSEDYVVEINPRLTTSYVGLRAATRMNLAGAMLQIAAGDPVDLVFDDIPIRFEADGTVEQLARAAR